MQRRELCCSSQNAQWTPESSHCCLYYGQCRSSLCCNVSFDIICLTLTATIVAFPFFISRKTCFPWISVTFAEHDKVCSSRLVQIICRPRFIFLFVLKVRCLGNHAVCMPQIISFSSRGDLVAECLAQSSSLWLTNCPFLTEQNSLYLLQMQLDL